MPGWDQPLSRGQFLGTAAAAAAGPFAKIARGAAALPAGLPKPAHSGIDHVVVVMMENRSFDHFLGWLPGADGKQAGLTYLDAAGTAHQTHPLAPDFQGCAQAGTTRTRSATTSSRTFRSSGRSRRVSPRATAISRRSSPRRFPTGSTPSRV